MGGGGEEGVSTNGAPDLLAGGAIIGHVVPGGHESPGGSERDSGEILVDVLGDEFEQRRVSGLAVEDLPSQDVVHVAPIRCHKGAPVGEGEGVWGVLFDLGVEGDHAVVVHLQRDNGVEAEAPKGGTQTWGPTRQPKTLLRFYEDPAYALARG